MLNHLLTQSLFLPKEEKIKPSAIKEISCHVVNNGANVINNLRNQNCTPLFFTLFTYF